MVELLRQLRCDAPWLLCSAIAAALLLGVTLAHESAGRILLFAIQLLWLFGIPGYALLLYLAPAVRFPLRVLLGIGVHTALLIILSYTLTWFGPWLHVMPFLIPVLSITIGPILFHYRKRTANLSLFKPIPLPEHGVRR